MFERLWVRIPAPYGQDIFSHWFVVKIVLFVWKDEKFTKKWPGLAHLKKTYKFVVFAGTSGIFRIRKNMHRTMVSKQTQRSGHPDSNFKLSGLGISFSDSGLLPSLARFSGLIGRTETECFASAKIMTIFTNDFNDDDDIATNYHRQLVVSMPWLSWPFCHLTGQNQCFGNILLYVTSVFKVKMVHHHGDKR